MTSVEKKKCVKCRKRKDLSEFYTHPQTSDRLQVWCKECQKTSANTRNKRLRDERRSL